MKRILTAVPVKISLGVNLIFFLCALGLSHSQPTIEKRDTLGSVQSLSPADTTSETEQKQGENNLKDQLLGGSQAKLPSKLKPLDSNSSKNPKTNPDTSRLKVSNDSSEQVFEREERPNQNAISHKPSEKSETKIPAKKAGTIPNKKKLQGQQMEGGASVDPDSQKAPGEFTKELSVKLPDSVIPVKQDSTSNLNPNYSKTNITKQPITGNKKATKPLESKEGAPLKKTAQTKSVKQKNEGPKISPRLDTLQSQKQIQNQASFQHHSRGLDSSSKDEGLMALPGLNSVKKDWKFFRTSKIVLAALTLLIGWLVLKYITLILNIISENWPKYRLVIKGFIPIIRIAGWSLVISFVIVGIFQPPIQSVIAFTASAGIAIGFASQDILKNMFGGILILFDRPFKVGDKIQIDDHYGEVVNIGLRTVRIVTGDDSQISIPNSEIISKSVSNSNSGEPDCQVVAEFFFDQDLDMDNAYFLAMQCAALSRYTFLNKPITVVFKNVIHMGQSMIQMRLKAYVLDHRFEFAYMTDLTRIVLREFKKAGMMARKHGVVEKTSS